MFAAVTKSATVITKKPLLVGNDLMTILVSRADTHNQYIVIELVTPPGGGMSLLHTHPAQETFYIVEGSYELYWRDKAGNKVVISAPAGTTVQVPSNTPHGLANVGDKPGKALLIFDAAGKIDDFFAEIGLPVENPANPPRPDGPPDMEALLKVCARYDMHFLEMPPV